MLEEAIKFIKKQIDMYKILEDNLKEKTNTMTILKARSVYNKRIQMLRYIMKVLKQQKQ